MKILKDKIYEISSSLLTVYVTCLLFKVQICFLFLNVLLLKLLQKHFKSLIWMYRGENVGNISSNQ